MRGFDILLSMIGIILLFPFFLVVAILIKLDSSGPIFFRQVRMGKDGRPFQLIKLRTMTDANQWTGPPLSPKNDPRVTTFGAILRRFKANEFPQLINVLKGDMSLVGPRPEVPEFVSLYGTEEQKILTVRPGIVGPSQVQMRNEEDLYTEGMDPKEYYINHILPKKLKIDLEYVNQRSFAKDLMYLAQGILITITGAITRRHLFENAEQIALFFCDGLICAFSYFLAYFLRVEGEVLPIHRAMMLQTLPFVIVARMSVLTYCGLYSTLVYYFSSDDLIRIMRAATISSMFIVFLAFLAGPRWHPRSVFAIDWFIAVFLLGGYRLAFKSLKGRSVRRNSEGDEDVLIFGAGNMGGLALSYLRMQGGSNVVAFIDDDPKKMRKNFQGVKILGNRYDIEALVRLYHANHVLIAMNSVSADNLEHIKSLCEKAEVSYEVFALAN